MDSDAASRRAARSLWETEVVRGVPPEAAADADAAFWLRIPPEDRANTVWDLSVEVFRIASRNGALVDAVPEEVFGEQRLPRSAFRVTRR